MYTYALVTSCLTTLRMRCQLEATELNETAAAEQARPSKERRRARHRSDFPHPVCESTAAQTQRGGNLGTPARHIKEKSSRVCVKYSVLTNDAVVPGTVPR